MSGPSKRGRSLAEFMPSIEEEEASTSPAARPAAAAERPRSEKPGRGGGQEEPAPGMVPLNIFVTPADRKRLRQLGLDADMSLQKLGHEAWNLLLTKRGLPPLQPVSANRPSGRTSRG